MERLDEDLIDRLRDGADRQGDAASLDEDTAKDAAALRRRMGDGSDPTTPGAALPIIWGSIRAISVYGKWSWWRKPKKKKIDDDPE